MDQHPARWPKGVLWVLVAIFALVVVVNIYRGLTVQKIGLLGFNIEFGSPTEQTGQPASLPQAVTPQLQQPTLPPALPAAAQPVPTAQPPEPTPVPPTPTATAESPTPTATPMRSAVEAASEIVIIEGDWYTQEGLLYTVVQDEDYVEITEFNPLIGLSAVFEGFIGGYVIEGDFQAVTGVFGSGRFQISRDAQRMDAVFTESSFGTSSRVTMFRDDGFR